MADKYGMNDIRELKLGASFTNNKAPQYHTIKSSPVLYQDNMYSIFTAEYSDDFKPASVDVNKMATVDVGTNHQVTVTVPSLDGAGVPQTVFKGSQRPYTKECVLIIDRVTGDITLEKLSGNIQVKKTRQECSTKPRPQTPVAGSAAAGAGPAAAGGGAAPAAAAGGAGETNTTQRSTSRTRVATNRRTHTIAGAGAGAARPTGGGGGMVRSPPRHKAEPPQAAPWSGGGNSTLASLPMIGMDDAPAPAPPAAPPAASPAPPAPAPYNGYQRAPPPAAPAHDRTAHAHNANARHLEADAERNRERERQAAAAAVAAAAAAAAPGPVPRAAPSGSASGSSSSSSSDSDSDSNSDSDDDRPSPARQLPLTNGAALHPPLPSDVLNDDLCLSESGSDSD